MSGKLLTVIQNALKNIIMKYFIVKTLVVLCFFAGHSGETSAQNTVEVPVKITSHFNSGFINASTVSWKKSSGTGYYVADFIEGVHYKKVVYSSTGSFLFSETRLAPGQLPENVSRTMSAEFFGFDMEQIRKVETVKEVTVKIRIRNKNARYEIEIDLSGKVRSKRKLPKEYEDEDHDHHHHDHHDHHHHDDDEDDHDDHGKCHKHKKKHKRDCDEDDND